MSRTQGRNENYINVKKIILIHTLNIIRGCPSNIFKLLFLDPHVGFNPYLLSKNILIIVLLASHHGSQNWWMAPESEATDRGKLKAVRNHQCAKSSSIAAANQSRLIELEIKVDHYGFCRPVADRNQLQEPLIRSIVLLLKSWTDIYRWRRSHHYQTMAGLAWSSDEQATSLVYSAKRVPDSIRVYDCSMALIGQTHHNGMIRVLLSALAIE